MTSSTDSFSHHQSPVSSSTTSPGLEIRDNETCLYIPQIGEIRFGDVVVTKDKGIGVIRYFGELPGSTDMNLGIELLERKTSGNGIYQGKYYWDCELGFGLFCGTNELTRKVPAEELLYKVVDLNCINCENGEKLKAQSYQIHDLQKSLKSLDRLYRQLLNKHDTLVEDLNHMSRVNERIAVPKRYPAIVTGQLELISPCMSAVSATPRMLFPDNGGRPYRRSQQQANSGLDGASDRSNANYYYHGYSCPGSDRFTDRDDVKLDEEQQQQQQQDQPIRIPSKEQEIYQTPRGMNGTSPYGYTTTPVSRTGLPLSNRSGRSYENPMVMSPTTIHLMSPNRLTKPPPANPLRHTHENKKTF